MLYGDQFNSFICSLFHSLIACTSFQFVSLSHLTFLTGIMMTITAFYVIPFIFIFNTKCMHTVLIPKIVWLAFGPSGKVSSTTICPSKGTLSKNAVKTHFLHCFGHQQELSILGGIYPLMWSSYDKPYLSSNKIR